VSKWIIDLMWIILLVPIFWVIFWVFLFIVCLNY